MIKMKFKVGVRTTFPEPDCTISLNVSTTLVSVAVTLPCDGLELTSVGAVESVLNWYEVPLMPAKSLLPLSLRAPTAIVIVNITRSTKLELGLIVTTLSEQLT